MRCADRWQMTDDRSARGVLAVRHRGGTLFFLRIACPTKLRRRASKRRLQIISVG
jgi:hypothetical protein